MKDIFAALTHACEKISENGPLKAGNYNTLKRMVTECTIAFESKHGSIENVPAVQYHLNEIEELYALIDNGLVCVDLGIRDLIETAEILLKVITAGHHLVACGYCFIYLLSVWFPVYR